MVQRHKSVFREELDEENEQNSSTAELSRMQQSTNINPKPTMIEGVVVRDLKATRSERWPWTTSTQRSKQKSDDKHTNINRESYIGVMQSACQQGYPTPPRREVAKYQEKPLPSTPDSNASSRHNTRATQSITSVKDFAKSYEENEAAVEISAGSAPKADEAMMSDLTTKLNNYSINDSKPAWLSRVEKRAESNEKAHSLLFKK